MATISSSVSKAYLDAYDGYNRQAVGLGLQTGTYATPEYQQRKIDQLAIGLLSDAVYSGFDHDPTPLALPIVHEPAYNTILSLNLHYVPESYRRAIMKFVLDSNAARIQSNQAMFIDWHALSAAIPAVRFITRRYKLIGIRPIRTYALNEIPDAISKDSPFQEHYKILKEGF